MTLKPGVLDPQGRAIEGALRALGIAGISEVRQGKLFELELEADDLVRAHAALKAASEGLLANPVIETYAIEVGS